MKIYLMIIMTAGVLTAAAAPKNKNAEKPVRWKLEFIENFSSSRLDEKVWTRIDKGTVDWNRNMSLRKDLVEVKNGLLILHGVKNDDLKADPRRVLTGGVKTQGKVSFLYGKIEIRCRFENQKGAWPAVWMMPENPKKGWPDCGEIDIIERLNSDDFVYQTVHSGWTAKNPNNPPKGGKGMINPTGWNVYALEWTSEKIVWKVNGVETHSYARVGDDPARYPWTEPFYLMIDMQLGGSWVGDVDESTLSCKMYVDWVKYYGAFQDGKKISKMGNLQKRKKVAL